MDITREQWLRDTLTDFIAPLFNEHGYGVDCDHIRVSCGWPSKSALARKKRRVGEAWANRCSDDHTSEIFISPCEADPIRVIGILVHEVVHAVVGVEHGHRKPFSQCAAKVGLTKPWTATGESEELVAAINEYLKSVDPYPHAKLDHEPTKKQSTRQILLECVCGVKIRTTRKWIEEYGTAWDCPCGDKLVLKDSV